MAATDAAKQDTTIATNRRARFNYEILETFENQFPQRDYTIEEFERPPMLEIEEYRQKFHAEPQPA